MVGAFQTDSKKILAHNSQYEYVEMPFLML
jgi:hypothetical protein